MAGAAIGPQPVIPQIELMQAIGNGFNHPRVVSQSEDGSEVVLAMDYTYDGIGGMSALVIPVIEKRNQKGIGGWFGTDPVAVVRGRGPISFKIKYFNDEAGVPPELTTDRIRMYFLNSGGTTKIGTDLILTTIKWGNPRAKTTAPPGP